MKKSETINKYRLFAEYERTLFSYLSEANDENYLDIFSKAYKFVKSITDDYCLCDCAMHDSYYYLLDYLLTWEESFESFKTLSIPTRETSDDNFLEEVVKKTREYLINDCVLSGYRGTVVDIDYTNKCVMSSNFVSDICAADGTRCYSLEIYPGYNAEARLFDGSGHHFANIVKYNGEYYLVDVTYSQFFYKVRENLDRLGIVDFSCCNVGTFVMMDEKRLAIAKNLLENGYIKLNEEILKIYLDAFTISFRNGLYYEETEDFSYTTGYTIEDYIRFLNGEDNQIRNEGRENLGYQKRPLRDSKLDFRKR